MLLNVFKEELPSTGRSHFGWFTVGLVGYAALLTLVTAAEPGDEQAAPEAGVRVAATSAMERLQDR